MMTKEQDQFIRDNSLIMTYREIGDVLGISDYSVRYYINKNNIPHNTNKLSLSKEDIEYIRSNYETMTAAEIGNHIGLTRRQVQGWLDNHLKDRAHKIRQFNDKYFSNIDTPAKAYWLGFIYADGWISIHYNKHYEFGIQLQREDEYMLCELNNELGGQHIIKHIHTETKIVDNDFVTIADSSVLRVYSKQLVLDLYNNGIDIKKSGSNIFPIVANELFPDFLRGYIDGDGCIHVMRRGILGVHITSANVSILEYIRNKLLDDYGISSAMYKEESETWRTKYRLYCFRKDDVKRLLDMIYYKKDLPKLERKYEKYRDFYGLAQ